MKSIKDKIKSSFSRSVLAYDNMSEIQDLVSDKMIVHLKCESFHKVLEIGSGTGIYTEKLIKLNRDAEFVLVDFAVPMIESVKKKLIKYKAAIKFLAQDVEKISRNFFTENYFDLITSSSTFQWLSNLEIVFSNLHWFLSPGGIFLFSYFGPETYKELNYAVKEYYKLDDLDIPAAKFLTKKKISELMKKVFHKIKIEEYKIEREYNSLYSLLSKIKQCGEYGYGLKKKVPFTRSDLKEIEKIYLDKYKKIKATYHFYIVFASKD